ncbi:MAG: ABC transporter ATP-binding protein [Candidatus Dojkabacteria bacterium]
MYLKATNLTKKYGSKVAVAGIDIEIIPGRILGLLGPNGAGKSTTIKMLSGQTAPSGGEIAVGFGSEKGGEGANEKDGKSYSALPPSLRKQIGVMPQELIIWEDMNIKENLEFTASLQGMRASDAKRRRDYLIEALHLERELKTLARNLSGGYKRRLNLAVSIIHEPKLVFLDEPTPGIDAQSRRFLMDFVQDMGSQEDQSIVLTDHYLDEAEKLSDYVVIIDQGKIVTEGTIPEIKHRHGDGNILSIDLASEHAGNSELVEKIKAKAKKKGMELTKSKSSLTTIVKDPVGSIQTAIAVLEESDAEALNISVKEPTLEDIFLLLTGKEIRE